MHRWVRELRADPAPAEAREAVALEATARAGPAVERAVLLRVALAAQVARALVALGQGEGDPVQWEARAAPLRAERAVMLDARA